MPDLNHVIDAHTSQMQDWWWDPEYIRERKAFVKRRPCPSCCEKYKRDPTTKIHYITPDQEMCRYCEPSYNPEVAKVRRERGNKIKRELNQGGYIKAHPFKKAIVNGRCVSIRR